MGVCVVGECGRVQAGCMHGCVRACGGRSPRGRHAGTWPHACAAVSMDRNHTTPAHARKDLHRRLGVRVVRGLVPQLGQPEARKELGECAQQVPEREPVVADHAWKRAACACARACACVRACVCAVCVCVCVCVRVRVRVQCVHTLPPSLAHRLMRFPPLPQTH